jgi:hypothetical protein
MSPLPDTTSGATASSGISNERDASPEAASLDEAAGQGTRRTAKSDAAPQRRLVTSRGSIALSVAIVRRRPLAG